MTSSAAQSLTLPTSFTPGRLCSMVPPVATAEALTGFHLNEGVDEFPDPIAGVVERGTEVCSLSNVEDNSIVVVYSAVPYDGTLEDFHLAHGQHPLGAKSFETVPGINDADSDDSSGVAWAAINGAILSVYAGTIDGTGRNARNQLIVLWVKSLAGSTLSTDLPAEPSTPPTAPSSDNALVIAHYCSSATPSADYDPYSPEGVDFSTSRLRELDSVVPDDLRVYYDRALTEYYPIWRALVVAHGRDVAAMLDDPSYAKLGESGGVEALNRITSWISQLC